MLVLQRCTSIPQQIEEKRCCFFFFARNINLFLTLFGEMKNSTVWLGELSKMHKKQVKPFLFITYFSPICF